MSDEIVERSYGQFDVMEIRDVAMLRNGGDVAMVTFGTVDNRDVTLVIPTHLLAKVLVRVNVLRTP